MKIYFLLMIVSVFVALSCTLARVGAEQRVQA